MEKERKELGMELNRDKKPPLGAMVQVMVGMTLYSAKRCAHPNGKQYYTVYMEKGMHSPVDDEDVYGWKYNKKPI